MKRKNLLIWILIALVVVLVVFSIIKSKKNPKGTEVETAKVEYQEIIETVSASGKIFPEKEIKISSDVSGEIIQLYVLEGDSVTTGQVLAKIDPEAYESVVERQRAAVNNSKAQVSISRSSVENAMAQVEQITSQLKNAAKIHNRNIQLLQDGVISQADFDNSASNVSSLEANKRSAEANYRSAQESVNAAQFAVKSAEAGLKEMRTSLGKTTIKAPVSGIISRLNVEQGERVVGTIQMAGTEMMRVANLTSMEAQVDVSENDILRVSVGDKTEIEVDAYLDRKFTGYITEIANSASNTGNLQSLTSDQVTNFVVKIRIDPESYNDLIIPGKPFPFRPGMSTSVDIITQIEDEAIAVPIQAVTTWDPEEEKGKKGEDEEKEYSRDLLEVSYLFTEADTAKRIPVKTGIQDDEYIQILEGLDTGQVVVSGPYSVVARRLKQGDQLRKKEKKEKK